MDSQTLLIVLITIAICALIGVGVWFSVSKMRSRRLKERFGPEYDRVVDQLQDRQLAETELQSRKERVDKYTIVPLSERDRANYDRAWMDVQRRFVDDPHEAVVAGDKLIFEVMEKRGYPVNGFEQAATDLSVDYPEVVTHYRAAAVIASRNRTGEAGTEELRQALVHYRALFHELLEAPASPTAREDRASNRMSNEFRLPRLKNRRGGLSS
jgi:FtsZ-interacting cell division protein ZipA